MIKAFLIIIIFGFENKIFVTITAFKRQRMLRITAVG